MKITFLTAGCIPLYANILEDRPLGGIETAVIRLAEALSTIGHEVRIVTNTDNPKLSEPLFISFKDIDLLGPSDILIVVREWEQMLMFPNLKAKLKLFWTGDSYDQPQTFGIGDLRVQSLFDKFLFVSIWHANTLGGSAKLDREKIGLLRNGIHSPYFEQQETRHPKRLIYSSTPYRGLRYLPAIYKEILNLHPDAELVICSGYKVYEGAGEYPAHVLEEYDEIIKELSALPNCKILGSIKQKELAKEFKQASVLAYPNIFEETSCISIMEGKAGGCIPVTSKLGALPETVGADGFCIEGVPGTESYNRAFVETINNIFNNPQDADLFRKNCLNSRFENSWTKVARELIASVNEQQQSSQQITE